MERGFARLFSFFSFPFSDVLRAEKCGSGRGKPLEPAFGRLSGLPTTSTTLVRARTSEKGGHYFALCFCGHVLASGQAISELWDFKTCPKPKLVKL